MSEWTRPYRKDANYWTRVFPDILTRYVNLDWACKYDERIRTYRDPVTGRAVSRQEGKHRREVYHKWNTIHRIVEAEERRGRMVDWRTGQKLYEQATDPDTWESWEEREMNIRRLVSP